MATREIQQYRGYEIVPMRQWEGWCAEAYSTRADRPFLTHSALDTLASEKEAAVNAARRSVDRLLEAERR